MRQITTKGNAQPKVNRKTEREEMETLKDMSGKIETEDWEAQT